MPWQTITFNDEELTWDNLPPEGEQCLLELVSGNCFVGFRLGEECPEFIVRLPNRRLTIEELGIGVIRKWKLLEAKP